MRRVLDTRQGLTCAAVTSVHDLDMPALLALLDEAWQADYQDQERLALDESFLRGLLIEPMWLGLVLSNVAGQIIGFELAQARTLYCHQQPFRAYYNTLFTVSAHYRRQGLGRWMLHCINQLLFAEQGADLAFVVFHLGHAGLPTVQHTHDQIPGWGMHLFHRAALWGRLLAPPPLPACPGPATVARLTVDASAVLHTPWHTENAPAGLTALPPALADIPAHCQVAFGMSESFQTRYLRRETLHAGTFWYDFGHGAHCSISFDMVTLVRRTSRLGQAGRIQTVYATHCTAVQLAQALGHLCHFFHTQGCTFAGVLDQGAIPQEVLTTLHFRRLQEERAFAVRGPREVLHAFTTVKPPYFIDL